MVIIEDSGICDNKVSATNSDWEMEETMNGR
jgi:hypothetical protein